MTSQDLPTERVVAYIDGFNLYYGLRAGGLDRFRWLDLHQLVQHLIKPHQTLEAIESFTTLLSPRADGKHLRQRTYLEAVATLPLLTITYGRYMRKEGNCYRCNHRWPQREEKMTDVNIAAHLTRGRASRPLRHRSSRDRRL